MIHALPLAVGIGILALACDSKPTKIPTPTTAESVTPSTAESTQPAATGTVGVSAAPAAPVLYPHPGLDELFIYTVATGEDKANERLHIRRSVVVQDLRAGRIVSMFPYSGKIDGRDRFPIGAALAGRQIVVADESEVARHELDGTNRTSLFIPSEPQKISDIAVSADGKLVAITSNCGSGCREQNLVSFVDVAKATVVSQVRQDDQRFTAFRGDVWQLVWRADGSGVFVSGATYSEQPGGRATVRVDGSVTVHPEVSGFLTVSPNGKLMAEGSPQLPCERVGGRSFAVTELDTGNLVAVADGEKGAYAAWEWSPDSSQVVYQFLPGDTATCDWAEGRQMEVRLIDLDAGTGEKVPNLRDLHLRWYGERFVEAVCKEARPEEPVRNRWGDTNAICKAPESGEQLGDLFLGGSRIANWPNLGSQFIGLGIEPVGFLTKAP